MMRVAMVVDSLRVGGAQKLVAAFASHASEYGITPVVISLREERAAAVVGAIQTAGVEIITMSAPTLFDRARLSRLIDFFHHERIDLVQTHLFYSNILGTYAAHKAGIPVIATLHSITQRKDWKDWIRQHIEDYCLRHYATRILAVGNMVAQVHEGKHGRRILDVIPNGIPQPQPIEGTERERLRKEITGNGSKTIIVTVGRFARAKGYEDMIKAFSLLKQKDIDPVLLMVGSGSMFNSIKEEISNQKLTQSVVLAGERHDVPQLLASSDVYASSSHREGLPLAVLEAMMAGLPVVATSVGDIPNVVTNETGVIVPPHQPELLAAALEDLVKHPEKRQAMGKAAQARAVNEYSVDAWMKKHLALYREVLAQHRRGNPA
jgi:glycosyltransferase involved in cell wall biosynthesis